MLSDRPRSWEITSLSEYTLTVWKPGLCKREVRGGGGREEGRTGEGRQWGLMVSEAISEHLILFSRRAYPSVCVLTHAPASVLPQSQVPSATSACCLQNALLHGSISLLRTRPAIWLPLLHEIAVPMSQSPSAALHSGRLCTTSRPAFF